jgi:hypothetical protein
MGLIELLFGVRQTGGSTRTLVVRVMEEDAGGREPGAHSNTHTSAAGNDSLRVSRAGRRSGCRNHPTCVYVCEGAFKEPSRKQEDAEGYYQNPQRGIIAGNGGRTLWSAIFFGMVLGKRSVKIDIPSWANTLRWPQSAGNWSQVVVSIYAQPCMHEQDHPLRESVLFIGTQYSNLYTAVDTPAEAAWLCVCVCV